MRLSSIASIMALTVVTIAAPLEANHNSNAVNLASDSLNRNAAEEAAPMAKREGGKEGEGDEDKGVHGVLSLVPTLLKGIKFNEPAHS
ncbi:uncharacterized protein ACHE_60304S [Aspergillus chevalieri]|uniref:RxLR effector protein n=1 Tax=Aspergillus chevalieri TaxID=182096 RepID=A0A7R7VTA6_ASPCH|nr:uncharacterized protein ACHE_60304S [Aspergillus chevalieri]BCR90418.1 hypothetical protein ACHE_60304S [Aspergillus chevalieri]